MSNKKTSLRESLLSYFESRKDGKSPDLTPKKKIKPKAPKRIPNQITSLPVDEGKRPDSGLPDIKKSIDSLVNALGKMTSSSNTTNNNKTINNNRNTFNNRTSNNNSSMNSLTTNDMFNSVRKSFTEQNINKSSGKMKNPKLIVSKTIPFIKNSLVNNSEETTNENNVITKDITNKIEKISKEITPKVIKLNKRKNDYKTTHASKKIPRVIELTKMNEKTQNVFKHLSNKMYTVVPSKTSSKILSSLIKYESNNSNAHKNLYTNTSNSSNINSSTNTSSTMQRNIDKNETFNNMMNVRNLIGKEKYNIMQVPALQDGGIVSKPTLAMVGEGGRPEEIRPIDRNSSSQPLDIQKSQNPSATSVGVDSMNKNAALKVEKENDPTSGGSDTGNQNMIVNAPTIPAQDAPARTNPSFEHGSTKSSKALSTQTHYPRWRRTMG